MQKKLNKFPVTIDLKQLNSIQQQQNIIVLDRIQEITLKMDKNQAQYTIQQFIKPLLQDQTTTVSTFRKASYDLCDFKIKYKTQKCRYWRLTGNCPFAETCAFAHGQFEIREKIHIAKNYKTKLCNKFEQIGFCKYGERCQFKHQMKEIKKKTTKLCKFSKTIQNYESILDTLPEKYSEGFISKRLKVFEEFEQDNFDKMDWHYKKIRLYSL